MKKLMIAAAIVCAAAISHGAALNWSMSGITGTATQQATGNVGYYMLASTWDAFSALTPDKVGAFCADNYAYTSTTTPGRGGASLIGKSGDVYSGGDDASGYIVLFDNADATKAANYANTTVWEVTIPSSGDGSYTAVFASDTAGWKEIPLTPVPEPTSGLLLLIGVAGLALKRRRA